MDSKEQKNNLGIPLWFRAITGIFFVGISGLLGLALVMPARSYFGLDYETIIFVLFMAVCLVGIVALWFVFFQKQIFTTGLYWLFYRLRWYVFLLALYGLVEYALRLPLIYFVYLKPHLNTILLFSIRGLVPLAGLGIIIASVFLASPIDSPFSPGRWQEKLIAAKEQILSKVVSLDGKWSAILPALLPPVMVLVVIYGIWGAKLSDYLPVVWNDSTGYWLWIRQFSHYGFGGGYNYANELMPAATFNRFGEGSPLYVYFYGTIGRLLGWSPHLPILVNFALLSGTIYIYSRALKLGTAQNLILALVTAVSWPVLIFSATTSHESLNQAIAIVLAGVFLFLIRGNGFNTLQKISIVIFAFLAGMLRLSWVILFFPLFFHIFDGSLLRRVILSVLAGGGLALGIILATRFLVPPINNSIFATLSGSLPDILIAISDQFLTQFRHLIRPGKLTPGLATIFIALLLLGYSIQGIVLQLRQKQTFKKILKSQAFFDFYNIIALLLTGMTLYLSDGFYRVFFPPLMVSLFMHIAQKKYQFIKAMLVFSLLFAPVIFNGKQDFDGAKLNYTYRMPELVSSQEAVDKLVVFDDETDNPWCNTILIPLGFYDARLTALHPGIGISYILRYPFENIPPRSYYLLLDSPSYEALTNEYNLRAVQLAELPIGNLYRNLDSGCNP